MSHLQTDSRTNFLHILLKYFETKFSVFKARLRLQHEKICIVDNILWSIKKQHTIVVLRFKLLLLITSSARWGNFYRIHLHPCNTFHFTLNMPFRYIDKNMLVWFYLFLRKICLKIIEYIIFSSLHPQSKIWRRQLDGKII